MNRKTLFTRNYRRKQRYKKLYVNTTIRDYKVNFLPNIQTSPISNSSLGFTKASGSHRKQNYNLKMR